MFGRSGGTPLRIIIGLIVAVISVISYYMLNQKNPVTGEKQHIDITQEQEIALGLQAAPEMAQQYGGLLQDESIQKYVHSIGEKLVNESDAKKSGYDFNFYVLADQNTVNAFALPGGQIFITAGLLSKLRTEGELAGVLGHEIGHVIERHSAEHIAKAKLTQGLTGAAVIATYDPDNPSSMQTAAVAALIGNLINMKFGRDDELESDKWGVRILHRAGYNPEAMIGVMEVLREAGGTDAPPEFFSTHPNPENRIALIRQAIEEELPKGIPEDLKK